MQVYTNTLSTSLGNSFISSTGQPSLSTSTITEYQRESDCVKALTSQLLYIGCVHKFLAMLRQLSSISCLVGSPMCVVYSNVCH